ncbi:CPBP family intramembrane glutamic endopeptidase [Bacillus sp. 1P10SD]|uniref:CPBP family glutamic-type intramembrane protease n=1 Tax=Bacillus sp. 1P10SD TaxID=3132265 RepID=UPI0039A4B16A
MKKELLNSNSVQVRIVNNENKIGRRIVFSLVMRTILFILFGALLVGFFALAGESSPLHAAEKWWPFQAIFANIVTFLILRSLLKKEGHSYFSIFNFKKGRAKKDTLETLWLVIVGIVAGAIPLFLFSYLLLGTFTPPEVMFQKLPIWAAATALILFPISNGLVETPTYIGYALPRIKARTGKLWLAITLSGLFLAFQHVALPLVFDGPYMMWRFLSFVPLAIILGIIFNKTNRLLPIAIAHFLMDLQLVVQLMLMTMK